MRSIVYRLVIMLCCGFLWNASQVQATPVVDQVPCHADKCYTVIVDCPKCCKVHCIKLRFDESGHLEGFDCNIIKEIIRGKKYIVKYDCDGDGKVDLVINATFKNCHEPCGKIKGTITHICRNDEENGTVSHKEKHICRFVGYTRNHEHEESECCERLDDPLDDGHGHGHGNNGNDDDDHGNGNQDD